MTDRLATCPRCGGELLPVRGPDHVAVVGNVCTTCGYQSAVGVERPKRAGGRPAVSEEQVQGAIVRALRGAGYEVLITSRRRRRCVHCGRYSAGGDGASRGLPDLLVWDYRRCGWLGIEVKGPRTSVSPEQRALAERGMIVVARSVAQALAALTGEIGAPE